MNEPQHRTIRRRLEDRKLEIGESVSIKEGVIGIVLARYVPSGATDEVHYIVELRPDEEAKRAP